MKAICSILVLVLVHRILAQETILHHHKFPNGKTSTIIVLKDEREGYAKAYDFKGKEIYHGYIRRFAGSASVSFKHHPNGMVSEAHASEHPDAGIQWYNTWTTFDDQGNKTGERHSNWDDLTTIRFHYPNDTLVQPSPSPVVKPIVQPTVKPQPSQPKPVQPNPVQKKETVECASIHVNLTQFVNHSKQRILLNINHAGKDTLIILKPGKTYHGPKYISAQISSPLGHNVRIAFNCTNKKFTIDSAHETIPQGELETLHKVHFYSRRK